jgi:hypothetical protein
LLGVAALQQPSHERFGAVALPNNIDTIDRRAGEYAGHEHRRQQQEPAARPW